VQKLIFQGVKIVPTQEYVNVQIN